jgi:membrane protein required for colicin V production
MLGEKALFMNALDIGICIIAGFCLVRGLFRGIIKEVTAIVGVLVGFYGAYTYYPLIAKWLSQLIANKSYLNIISFFIVFTVVFFTIGFLGVVLKHIFRSAAFGWADRILGGAFAMVKAILIVSVLLIALTAFLPKNAPVMTHSRIAPHVSATSEKLVAAVPLEMREEFRDKIKALKESWETL